jgi:hypothetical protein
MISPKGDDSDLFFFFVLFYFCFIFPPEHAEASASGATEPVVKPSEHDFTLSSIDWGFNSLMPLSTVFDADEGFVVDDVLEIEAELDVFPVGSLGYYHSEYDSHKETGMVGLRNQGATCYMNSMLQALFHTHEFRRGVYLMNTPAEREAAAQAAAKAAALADGAAGGKGGKGDGAGIASPTATATATAAAAAATPATTTTTPEAALGDSRAVVRSIPYALQKVFYRMQTSKQAVSTKELTKSFGWDSMDSFTQHDVQEFNRVLVDNIEEKMKGTPAEGLVSRLYSGTILNYIDCVGVDYSSKREENFFDLQLLVKGCKDLEASFDDYVEVEKMEGDNKYMAEGHGLQDARKGVRFLKFPPVLTLHLRRFEYDPYRDDMVKVNDRYVFPETVDLDSYLDESVREAEGPQRYHLFSVLVHSGDVSGGHYYAFVRPQPLKNPEGWFKFDDDRVTPSTRREAVDDNFGAAPGYNGVGTYMRCANAYMLVYLREADLPRVQAPFTPDDVPQALRAMIDSDLKREERRRREREESHLYIQVRVAGNHAAALNTADDIVDWDAPSIARVRVKRTATFAQARRTIIRAMLDVQDGGGNKAGGGGGNNNKAGGGNNNNSNDDTAGGDDDESMADARPIPSMRLLVCTARKNKTTRPDYVAHAANTEGGEDAVTFEAVIGLEAKTAGKPVCIFALPSENTGPLDRDHTLLALRWYDPLGGVGQVGALNYLGMCILPPGEKLSVAEGHARALAGIGSEQPLIGFEEITSKMVEPLDLEQTPPECEIGTGDLLIFQTPPAVAAAGTGSSPLPRHPTAVDYLRYITSIRTVAIYPLDSGSSASTRDPSYKEKVSIHSCALELADRVAVAIGAAPGHVRLVPSAGRDVRLPRSGINATHMYAQPSQVKTESDGADADPASLLPPPPLSISGLCEQGAQTRSELHPSEVSLFYEVLDFPLEHVRGKTHISLRWNDLLGRIAAEAKVEAEFEADEVGCRLLHFCFLLFFFVFCFFPSFLLIYIYIYPSNLQHPADAAAAGSDDENTDAKPNASGGSGASSQPTVTPGEIAKAHKRRKKALAEVAHAHGPRDIELYAAHGATVGDIEAQVREQIGDSLAADVPLRFVEESLSRNCLVRPFRPTDDAAQLAKVVSAGMSYSYYAWSSGTCVRVEPVADDQRELHRQFCEGAVVPVAAPAAPGAPAAPAAAAAAAGTPEAVARLVQIVHVESSPVYRGTVNLHGIPFYLAVGATESIRSVRARIAAALGLTAEELQSTKSSFIEYSTGTIVDRTIAWDNDDMALLSFLKPRWMFGFNDKKDVRRSWDSTPSSYRYRSTEKAIKIYN